MEIIKYPDPVLRRGGQTVDTFDAALRETAAGMFEAMYRFGGVGLAAPQVGLELKLLVLNPAGSSDDRREEMALVNPEIVGRKGFEWGDEGCLSFPGIYAEVERSKDIEIVYRDLDGTEHRTETSGFLSRVIQHELDHLEGILFVDRFSPADRIRVKARLLEMERAFKAPA